MSARSARSRRGFALFLSLLLLLVLTISGVALMFNTSVEDTLAATETKVSKTFYAADSGLEYAGANLQPGGSVNWVGGQMPNGLSTNYPGTTTPDIKVTLSAPLVVGYIIHSGDEIQSQGSTYPPSQIAESVNLVTSTATATSIQATKTISAEIGVYPTQISLH